MYKFSVIVFFTYIVRLLEGRVYCQDAHASPWVPLGYSCPVKCQNIINAIEKLKLMDYRKLLEDDQKRKLKINETLINNSIDTASSVETQSEEYNSRKMANNRSKKNKNLKHKSHKHYVDQIKDKSINIQGKERINGKDIDYIDNNIEGNEQYYKMASKQSKQDGAVLLKENFVAPTSDNFAQIRTEHFKIRANKTMISKQIDNKNFEYELKKAFENITCDWIQSKQPYILIEKLIRECQNEKRRYGDDFLRTLTRTMNRFSKTSVEFTEDMVEMVLERVFGKNVVLHDHIFDVNKLLHYLRNAIEQHKMHRERGTTIVLKPRHCLSLSLPGCFCRPGFVENSGQCVKPADCISDSINEAYLTRIIVH